MQTSTRTELAPDWQEQLKRDYPKGVPNVPIEQLMERYRTWTTQTPEGKIVGSGRGSGETSRAVSRVIRPEAQAAPKPLTESVVKARRFHYGAYSQEAGKKQLQKQSFRTIGDSYVGAARKEKSLTTGRGESTIERLGAPSSRGVSAVTPYVPTAPSAKAPRSQFRTTGGSFLLKKERTLPGGVVETYNYGTPQQQRARKKEFKERVTKVALQQMKAKEQPFWIKELEKKQRASKELRSGKPLSRQYRASLQAQIPKVQKGVLSGSMGLLTTSIGGKPQKNLGITEKSVKSFYAEQAVKKSGGLGGAFAKFTPQEKTKSPSSYYAKRVVRGGLGGAVAGLAFSTAKSTTLVGGGGMTVAAFRAAPAVAGLGYTGLGLLGTAAQADIYYRQLYKGGKEVFFGKEFKGEGLKGVGKRFLSREKRRFDTKVTFAKKYSGEIVEGAAFAFSFGAQQLGEKQLRFESGMRGGFGKVYGERRGTRLGSETVIKSKGEFSADGKRYVVKARTASVEKPFGVGSKSKDVTFYDVFEKTPKGKEKFLGTRLSQATTQLEGTKWKRYTKGVGGYKKSAEGSVLEYSQGQKASYLGKIYSSKGKPTDTIVGRSQITYGKSDTLGSKAIDSYIDRWESDVVSRKIPKKPPKLPKMLRGSKAQFGGVVTRSSTGSTIPRPSDSFWTPPASVKIPVPSVSPQPLSVTQSAGLIPRAFGIGGRKALFALAGGGASFTVLGGAALAGGAVGYTSRPKLGVSYQTQPLTKSFPLEKSITTSVPRVEPLMTSRTLTQPKVTTVPQPVVIAPSVVRTSSSSVSSFTSTGSTFVPPQPMPFLTTPPPPPILFPGFKPSLQFMRGRRRKTTLKKQKTRYTPSVVAIEFNIRGKQPKKLSGLGIRPLPLKKKKLKGGLKLKGKAPKIKI